MSKQLIENSDSEPNIKTEKSTADVFEEALSLLEDTVPVSFNFFNIFLNKISHL